MQNRLTSHHVWQIKIVISHYRGPSVLRNKGSQPHTRPPAQGSGPEREVPVTSGCKYQQGLWLSEMGGFWNPRQFLLKGLCTDLLRLTPSELQLRDRSLKGTRDIWGVTE